MVLVSKTTDSTAMNEPEPALVQFEGVKLAQLLHRGSPQIEQFPPFIERLRFYPDVPMAEAISRVYLPVQAQ